MKANELRLGNWIKTALSKDRGKPYQVVALRDNEVSTDKAEFQFNPIWTDLHYIKPIKLTEEWLLKFGFEKDILPDFYGIKLTHGEVLEVKLNGTICIGVDYNPPMIPFRCKYVHQLQNLYFALTGQELEIQELEKNES